MATNPAPSSTIGDSPDLRHADAAKFAAAARPRHAAAEVADYIRTLIFDGTLKGGERIAQDELAAALSLSRLPIREALITLESEGLVTIEPRRGAHVIPIAVADIVDHYRIYGTVHGMAAANSAASMTPEQRVTLRNFHESMCNSDDLAEVHDLNWSFHALINQTGGSRRIKAVLRQLAKNLPREVYDAPPNTSTEARDGHNRILAAIEAQDAGEAAAACRDHLAWEGSFVVDRLRQLGVLADA